MAQWAKMFNNLLNQGSEGRSGRTNTYVQRDLEDQIAEEYRSQGREYQRSDTNNSNNMSSNGIPEIVVQDVLDLLKKGYTRLSKDDKGHGSIQSHYGLTPGQIVKLFKHPKLKAKKTIAPAFNIVDRESSQEIRMEIDLTSPPSDYPRTVETAPAQDVVVTSTEDSASPAELILQRNQLFN